MPGRAFPVVYARDVGRSVAFYERLGFEVHFRLPEEGEPGYVGLRRGESELGLVTVESPRQLLGLTPGREPSCELFVYVDDVDAEVDQLRRVDVQVLREPEDMFWGERLAYVADPDGNPVALAAAAAPD